MGPAVGPLYGWVMVDNCVFGVENCAHSFIHMDTLFVMSNASVVVSSHRTCAYVCFCIRRRFRVVAFEV
jgi:hypothetical protein